MKIVTWNCNGAFRKKFQELSEFQADILIIQECENPKTCTDEKYKEWANNYLWISENKNKGVGIFAKPNIKLETLDWENNGLKYFIPCKVNDDFLLLAAWCHGANSPTFGYIGQLWKYMQLNKSSFKKIIIAGDFNANAIWDKWDRWWNFSDVSKELSELGIVSLYHKHYEEDDGKETMPTLYLQKNLGKKYHVDYIFASEEIADQLSNLEVGKENWLEISDHMPIFCEIKI